VGRRVTYPPTCPLHRHGCVNNTLINALTKLTLRQLYFLNFWVYYWYFHSFFLLLAARICHAEIKGTYLLSFLLNNTSKQVLTNAMMTMIIKIMSNNRMTKTETTGLKEWWKKLVGMYQTDMCQVWYDDSEHVLRMLQIRKTGNYKSRINLARLENHLLKFARIK